MNLIPPAQRVYRYVARALLISPFALSALFLPIDFFSNQSRAATTFTVNSLADTGDVALGNGQCLDAGGACTLRAAMQEANALAGDDTINVSVTGTINLAGPLPDITSNMVINGPGVALLTVRRDTGGDYRIFLINNRDVSISGMTITNGRSGDAIPGTGQAGQPGGGIRQIGGSLTLTDVVVTGNRSGNGAPIDSQFTAGWGGSGGGIDSSGVLTMTNVAVTNNATGNGATSSVAGSGGGGGGISFSGSILTMTNVSVTGNTTGNAGVSTGGGLGGSAGGFGAGMHVGGSTLLLTKVTISNNTAGDGDDGGWGGGLYLFGTAATIVDSTIANNTSGQGGDKASSRGGFGGGMVNNGGQIDLVGCVISGNLTKATIANVSGGHGGGIYNLSTLRMTNSTVSGNHAAPQGGRGGGIYNVADDLTLTNVTITGNTATTASPSQNGQGIHNTLTTNVRNTIIAGNGTGTAPDVTGIFNSQGHNLIGKAVTGGDGNNGDQTGFTHGVNGDQVGTPGVPIDPKLGTLSSNGGPTQTHKLLAGSPALDAGSNALAKDKDNNTLTSDQRGAGRFANSVVDIGAFEFHSSLENVTDKITGQNIPLVVSFSVGDTLTNITSVTATSDNQTLVPNSNLSLTGTGTVRTLHITPALNQTGSTLITLAVSDSGVPVSSDTFTLTVIPINLAPSFTVGANQITNEDSGPQSAPTWATNISPGSPSESGQTLTFLVTSNTNPGLFSASPAITSTGDLTYTPAANVSGTALIQVVLKDNGGTVFGGQDTSSPASFTITVNAVNDAPTFTKGADQAINEDAGFQFVSNWATNITVGANESAQSLTFLVTDNTNPALFVSAPVINSTGSLSYSSALNASGSATITIVLKDGGGTTNGGQDTSAAQTFTITVNAVNDPPVNQVPFSVTAIQNTPLVFSTATFNAISVSDVDAGGDPISVTLTATQGILSLSGATGVTLVTGDGVDDTTVTFVGALANVNAALNGLTFKPNTSFLGFASVQINTNDQGHNGSGGAQSDTDAISINVRSAGVIEFSSAIYAVNEDTGMAVITVTRSGGNAGATSVNYSSANGTGVGDSNCSSENDFVNSSGTLTWANNDSSVKSFVVPICIDSVTEGDETVNLLLSNVTGTASLGTRTTGILTITNDDAPVLLLEENSDRAIALDSVTQIRDPFTLLNEFGLSTDKRRRVSLFVWRLGLLPTDTVANVTAFAEDDVGTPYPLVVEYVGPVTGLTEVTQVVVKLPDSVLGIPRDLFVRVTLRGPASNRGRISISGP